MKSTKKSNESDKKLSLKREKIVVLGARTGVKAGVNTLIPACDKHGISIEAHCII